MTACSGWQNMVATTSSRALGRRVSAAHPRSFSFTSVTNMKGSSCWTSQVKKIGPSRDAKSKFSLVSATHWTVSHARTGQTRFHLTRALCMDNPREARRGQRHYMQSEVDTWRGHLRQPKKADIISLAERPGQERIGGHVQALQHNKGKGIGGQGLEGCRHACRHQQNLCRQNHTLLSRVANGGPCELLTALVLL